MLLFIIIYEEEFLQWVGDEMVMFYYMGAGYINGDSFVYFEEVNVVYMGDLMFNCCFFYIDKSVGVDISNWIDLLCKVCCKFDKDMFYVFGYVGEGYEVMGIVVDLKVMVYFLKMVLCYGKKVIKCGDSFEDFISNMIVIFGVLEYKGDECGVCWVFIVVYIELGQKV